MRTRISLGPDQNNSFYAISASSVPSLFYYPMLFGFRWSLMGLFIPIYFCILCFALRNILLKNKEKLICAKNSSRPCLFQRYDEISEMISFVNKNMQSFLLLNTSVLLANTFYSAYNLVFVEYPSTTRYIYYCICLFSDYFMFVAMCMFASTVSNAAVDFEEMMLAYPACLYEKKDFLFLLKIRGRFNGFKLLDSLIIDKNLILSATGCLLTYGLMIATFSNYSEI